MDPGCEVSGETGSEPERPPDETSKVIVSGYRLEVGAPTGISISVAAGPAAEPTEQQRLASAVEQEDRDEHEDSGEEPAHSRVDEVEISVGTVEDLTEQVERADKLWVDFVTGRLDIVAVNNGIDSLLATLERLTTDSDRFQDQLRLARSLSRLLAVAMRWIELLRSLRAVLRGAKAHGDTHAKAWALHELGTLRLAARDFARGDQALTEASSLRRQLGDRVGRASTDRNLQVLCRTLRQLVREGLLVERRGLRYRIPAQRWVKRFLSHATVLAAVSLLLLSLTGGVLAATLGGGGTKALRFQVAATLVTHVEGQGHVASDPVGIACPTRCTARFRPTTPVTLTATAGARGSFAGWRGACTGRGLCVVGSAGIKTVVARFVLQPPAPPTGATLTVRTVGNGSIRSDPKGINCPSMCSARFAVGQVVTLIETPAKGSAFTSWSGDCAGTGECALDMGADHSALGSFSATPRLNVAIAGPGSITSRPAGIACPGTCSGRFRAGTAVVLVPHNGGVSGIRSWTGDCSGSGPCIVAMMGDRSVGAVFSGYARDTITGSASLAGEGSVSATSSSPGQSCSGGSCTVDSGGDVTLIATPNSGYAFTGWSGACDGQASQTCTLSDVTTDQNAIAGFAQRFTVTGSASLAGEGSVSATSSSPSEGSVSASSSSPGASCSGAACTLSSGSNATLIATPNSGDRFKSWGGACFGQKLATCVLTDVTTNESAIATFEPA